MERTIFVTLSREEREKYRAALQQARVWFLDADRSMSWRVSGYLLAKAACSLPWNLSAMNFDLDINAVESLFRMRNENQRCPVCGLHLVNIILACNHAFCFSCLHRLHQRETFPDYPACPRCLEPEFRDFVVPSTKMIAVLNRVDNLLRFGGYKTAKIIILHDNETVHSYYSAALRGLNVPFYSYGEDSNDHSIRMFIASNTRTILMPIGALTEGIRFYFPPNSQLLVTYGVKVDERNVILSQIQTYGDEDTLLTDFFVAKNTVEEVIINTEAPYSMDLMYAMLTVAAFLPDD